MEGAAFTLERVSLDLVWPQSLFKCEITKTVKNRGTKQTGAGKAPSYYHAGNKLAKPYCCGFKCLYTLLNVSLVLQKKKDAA